DKGSIEDLVTKMHVAYRTELFRLLRPRGVDIDLEVGGYYALRGYLRLGLPATIEDEIRNSVTRIGYAAETRLVEQSDSAVLSVLQALPL
ncbi:hypothetical protein ABTN75_20145, partial [Acinetobacter baumannii]